MPFDALWSSLRLLRAQLRRAAALALARLARRVEPGDPERETELEGSDDTPPAHWLSDIRKYGSDPRWLSYAAPRRMRPDEPPADYPRAGFRPEQSDAARRLSDGEMTQTPPAERVQSAPPSAFAPPVRDDDRPDYAERYTRLRFRDAAAPGAPVEPASQPRRPDQADSFRGDAPGDRSSVEEQPVRLRFSSQRAEPGPEGRLSSRNDSPVPLEGIGPAEPVPEAKGYSDSERPVPSRSRDGSGDPPAQRAPDRAFTGDPPDVRMWPAFPGNEESDGPASDQRKREPVPLRPGPVDDFQPRRPGYRDNVYALDESPDEVIEGQTNRWPALLDSNEPGAREFRDSGDLERRRREWRRRERLDHEQRGIAWNESHS